ncbi:MAG: type II secretion system GspH family protein [Deferribacteraceae bacterium]|jgi:prepilin-type N-terminal cleavage/methylation domain-containing protein|nr:type II secretion system GspH family protein [Deferribacteraceae bacterium]
MKRGFNLIELAVVFLLIGLISAMVYKGKELLDTASIRAEVNKMAKLRTAVATIMTLTAKGNIGELEYDNVTKSYNLQPFFELDLISAEDITVQGSSDNLTIRPCINKKKSFAFDPTGEDGSMICAKHDNYPVEFTCFSEVMIDNQDLATGLGVTFISTTGTAAKDNISPGMDPGVFDCYTVTEKNPQVFGFILYR